MRLSLGATNGGAGEGLRETGSQEHVWKDLYSGGCYLEELCDICLQYHLVGKEGPRHLAESLQESRYLRYY